MTANVVMTIDRAQLDDVHGAVDLGAALDNGIKCAGFYGGVSGGVGLLGGPAVAGTAATVGGGVGMLWGTLGNIWAQMTGTQPPACQFSQPPAQQPATSPATPSAPAPAGTRP